MFEEKDNMKEIMTVCGSIAPDALGLTSMHDHILADLSGLRQPIHASLLQDCPINLDDPIKMENLCYLRNGLNVYARDNWDLTDVDLMTKEVQYFGERGGNTILEPSSPGIRHNVEGLKSISEATQVNIIASTGLYKEDTWPIRFMNMGPRDLRAYLLDEIQHGIDGSEIRAGHIKTAIAKGTEKEFNFIKAAVPVSNDTGLLVTAHTSPATAPEKRRKLLQTFLQEGMKLEKLLLCHIQYSFVQPDVKCFLQHPEHCKMDLTWAKAVLDQGANICIDLFGYPLDNEMMNNFGRSDVVKMLGLIKLIRLGYSDQIVIGNDVYQKIMTRSYGGHGYSRILDFVIPTLLNYGIDKNIVEKIVIHNPARLLQY